MSTANGSDDIRTQVPRVLADNNTLTDQTRFENLSPDFREKARLSASP